MQEGTGSVDGSEEPDENGARRVFNVRTVRRSLAANRVPVLFGAFAAQNVLRLASNLVLTRLLAPEAFGVIGVLMSINYVLMMLIVIASVKVATAFCIPSNQPLIVNNNIIAGPFHPAFRSLVEGSIFLDLASSLLKSAGLKDTDVVFSVAPRDVSNLRGMKNRNIWILKESFNLTGIEVRENEKQERWSLEII